MQPNNKPCDPHSTPFGGDVSNQGWHLIWHTGQRIW